MNNKDEFYISLPANSGAGYFSENTNSHFFTKLNTHLNFKNDEWEIALTDLFYPRTWINIPDGVIRVVRRGRGKLFNTLPFLSKIADLSSSFERTHENLTVDKVEDISLARGGIETIRELITKINDSFKGKELEKSFFISYDAFSNKSYISIREGIMVFMSDDLYETLGFKRDVSLVTGCHFSPFACDPDVGFRSIYVYSNLIEKRIVGDYQVPLLRSVPTKGERNSRVHEAFLVRQYLKAAKVNTDIIEIRLTTDEGKNIPFSSGIVYVNIHVRRRKK